MGLFSFVSRIGNKIADGVHSVASVGKKVLGTVHSVGKKIASTGKMVTNVISRVPVIGQVAAPVVGVANSALGMIENVADVAGAGAKILDKGDRLVQTGRKVMNAVITDPGASTNPRVQRSNPVNVKPAFPGDKPGQVPLFKNARNPELSRQAGSSSFRV